MTHGQTLVAPRCPISPVPPVATRSLLAAGALVIGIGFGGMTAWAAFAPISSAVSASGALVPESGRKAVRHATGGPIEEVLVKGGDQVKAGQVLIRLDRTEESARLDILTSSWLDAVALVDRLSAELSDATAIHWSEPLLQRSREPAVGRLMQNQQTLFDVRKDQYISEKKLSVDRVEALNAQVVSLERQRASVSREADLVAEELAVAESLLARGNGTRSRVAELRRDAARLDGRQRELETETTRVHQQITETRSDLARKRNDIREKTLEDLEKARAEETRQAEQIRDAANRLASRDIKAPEDGAVVLHGHPVAGGIITASEPILDIVPVGGPLLAEVKVSPKDIKSLAIGLPVRAHLNAYDQRVVGALDGVVEYVSADRVTDPMSRDETFIVRIRLDGTVGDTVHDLKMKAGMPVDAQITLASHTPLDYLVTPLKLSYLKAFIQE